MADDKQGRNFRTYFYNKFGVRGVEEKKLIESLWKEERIDVEKLRQLCLRFPIPSVNRIPVWKILLGVWPPEKSLHELANDFRKQQYTDLYQALKIMKRINHQTPSPEIFLKMFLMDEGVLPLQDSYMMSYPQNKTFYSMATAVCSLTEDTEDQYWITAAFFRYLQKYSEQLEQLTDKFEGYLKKEDTSQRLWQHLHQHHILKAIPLTEWFQSCFAGVLPDTSFERIWDKVVGGSCMILVYVAVSIFTLFQRPLLTMANAKAVASYLEKIPGDSGDSIVNKAMDLLAKYGAQPQQMKSESPAFMDRLPP